MTDAELIRGMGVSILRADYSRHQMARYAQAAVDQHGPAFLERVPDCVELDPDGRVRVAADPGCDPEAELAGAVAAGYVLAQRYLDQGQEPAEVRRGVMGRARTLSRAWPGSEYDRIERLKAYRRGVRKALAGAGQE